MIRSDMCRITSHRIWSFGLRPAVFGAVLIFFFGGMTGCAHRSREQTLQPRFEPSRSEAPVWPVLQENHRISSPYGELRVNANGETRRHHGVDIPAPEGTPVLATDTGIVTFSGTQRGYGNTIVLSHGSREETLYAHLSERVAEVAARVRRGQIIGRVGKSGNATAPHLHYEVRRNGCPVDPSCRLPKQ